MHMATTTHEEQAMTTTQINTRAAIIRHAINATRFEDNTMNRFTWQCLFDKYGAEAMGDANCYLPSDFNVIVDMAREAIATGRDY
jgi:hypothetical protein